MKKIKLMADYFCYPLWEDSPGEVGNINPKDLPISHTLQRQLLEWADTFDSILNMEDPVISGFESVEDERDFLEEGKILLERLRLELGVDYEVRMHIY